MLRPTYAQIDLERIAQNIARIRGVLSQGTKLMAVVKANAYGHGAIAVSQKAIESGVDMLGVSIPEEGIELRNAGITAPILVLGGIRPHSVPMVLQYGLSQTVFSAELLHALEQAARERGAEARIHLKVDTGMNRVGVTDEAELTHLLAQIKRCSHMVLEGVCTHFAVSEIEDKSFTLWQAERFMKAAAIVRDMGFSPMLHASNSGAALDLPELDFDLVRSGLSIYGYAPGALPTRRTPELLPAMEFKSTVIHVKTIHKGDTVSYGRLFEAAGNTRVATLPVGYGDGYRLAFTGKGEVLIHGVRAPLIGRVCMDQCMADVSHIPDVRPGDEAVLLGEQEGDRIRAEEMAGWADTIVYEILLGISARVPRKYI